ncbi:MAG: 23S rRNA (uracil(1939)-C(5))-methyltransferase RlmD [Selenomonadales bacterium]|nr:23S rRNA (uracil(1939)-C(5))-methyltransferase RlmD [Selenomonadales bacterium]
MKRECPVTLHQQYEIAIRSLGHSGEGVGSKDDFTVFVPGALVGEVVLAKITLVKKNYAVGSLVRVIAPSEERVEPICPIYETCGGCQLQHLSYDGQLIAKRQQVVDALQRIGKQTALTVHPTLGASSPWLYRNKMQFPVGEKKGRTIIGCYAKGSHDIIATENCHIQMDANNHIVQAASKILTEMKIPAYREKDDRGVVRHIIGRVGAGGQAMAVIVTKTKTLPKAEEFVARLRGEVPALVSIMHNINPKRTNVILGQETHCLWGQKTIQDGIGKLMFDISAQSFFQVHTAQADVLYQKALAYADLNGNETVIDAYCGTGTISLFLAQKAKKVYGIEIVAPAIRDAKKNAETNRITNAEFLVGDAVEVMPRLYEQGVRADVVVVDPPRSGCDPIVLETFARMNPERIVYVSCNPASLARDIAVLNELGYRAEEVQPVDMFPQTSHVESVALLRRAE